MSPRAHAVCLVLIGALGLGTPVRSATAQGTCEVNNQASCTFGNDASHAITVTITAAVGMATSASSVTIPTPDGNSFANGFGNPALLGVTVRANQGWTLSIRSTQALWNFAGAEARSDRPAADLQWGTLVGGPFTDMTTTNVSMSSGAASGAAVINLYLRARYSWALDGPGTYSLPIQLTLTAP